MTVTKSSAGATLHRSLASPSTGSRGADRGGPSSGRVRVLHVIQNLNYGGMERLLADLVRGVRAERFESHVLVLQYIGRFGEDLEGAATVHQAPPQPRYSMLRPRALAREIARIDPDVVHTHSGVWNKTARAARAARVPRLIHTEHGRPLPDPWLGRMLDRHASRHTDVAVAVSDPVAEILRQGIVGGGCRVETVLNGVDTDRFRPGRAGAAIRSELGLGPDAPLLGSIGRLERIKGYDVMVEAFALLMADLHGLPEPTLVLAGDGSERAALETRAKELGIGGRVRFLGWRDDVEEMLGAFDLFTMSSRSEGTSISLLEAMSSGLCPVVTDVGGNRAVLGNQLDRRLVPSGSPPALAAAWYQALADPEQRQRDGAVARERVLSTYSARAMVEAYERLYDPTAEEGGER